MTGVRQEESHFPLSFHSLWNAGYYFFSLSFLFHSFLTRWRVFVYLTSLDHLLLFLLASPWKETKKTINP